MTHNNHEIIKNENAQEKAEKHESRRNAIHFIGMDRLIFTFEGNQNLLKQRCVSMALPSSVLAV
jgi:hypothetical protein